MHTPEDWIAAGYRSYPATGRRSEDQVLQKLVGDHRGRRYYITVYVYDRSRYMQHLGPDAQLGMPRWAFMPEVQFQGRDGAPTFDITMNGDFSIVDVDVYYEQFWRQLGCPYYELWEAEYEVSNN